MNFTRRLHACGISFSNELARLYMYPALTQAFAALSTNDQLKTRWPMAEHTRSSTSVGMAGGCEKSGSIGERQNESDAEGWARFERAVDAAVKSGPKHRVSQKDGASERAKKTHSRKDAPPR